MKEINTLFQLVKANVDFPNLTYLLLYQKDVVEAALSKNVAGRGADYLKKIVQVEIDLPQASRYRMFQIFEESLSRILERADPKMYWGQNRFQDVFLTSVWPFFRTLRDVKRFLATFDFYFNGHINCGVLEVNPIDLFLIEVIRTFDHKSYVLIQSSLAPGPESDSLIALAVDDNVATKRLNEKINAVVSRSELLEVERDQLQAILQNLFPQGKASDSRYEHDLRICHPKHFAKYFEHLLDKAPTSAAGVQDILGIVGNREAFASRLRQFSISGDLEDVFDKILVYFEAVPIEGAHNFIAALFDVGDEFPEERPGILQIDLNVTAARMIYYLLKKIPEEKKREDILMKSLETTGGVVQPVMTIHFLEPDKHERSDLKIFSEEQIERFRKIGVAKLEYFAHSGALWNSRLFARLIFIWRRWAGDEPVKGWLGSELAGAERKLEFLSRFVGRITSGNEIVSYTLGAKSLESLVSLENLLQGGGQAETGNDLHYAACQLLREALDRKQAGKPYDQIEIFVEKLRLRPDRQ